MKIPQHQSYIFECAWNWSLGHAAYSVVRGTGYTVGYGFNRHQWSKFNKQLNSVAFSTRRVTSLKYNRWR